ncbi:signal recognition particle-docking protein FtsY [Xanthobacter flavus]|uniref:signal recognition particle-docking protein FtsY n=1 Tax=Xanthobacter flavus TaxID=281 RepID=UPI001AE62F6B|nr:signal recognition particle-docking protein FtsY [Xanthobacter flavus]MBP2150185.1 fused signal recognition particle receptor [Xanthobacter flavus]
MSQQDGGNDKKKRGFWGWLTGEPAAETPVTPPDAPVPAAADTAPPLVAPERPLTTPVESAAAEPAAPPEPVAPELVAPETLEAPAPEPVEPEPPVAFAPEPNTDPEPVETAAPEPAPVVVPEAPAPELPPPPPEPVAVAPVPEPRKGFWSRLASGLARTASSLGQGITDLVSKRKLDAATLEELEEVLIRADLGVETSMRIVEEVGRGRHDKMISAEEVKSLIAAEVERILAPVAVPLVVDRAHKPFILLMVGVNGSGKTTTIGKLAAQWRAEGRKVVLAAGDTFRAAAIEQLKVWGERTGATVIAREQGADAAGVAHDAITEARAQNADILMIDTAGRLQNRAELMAELEKVVRVIKKQEPTAPHAVLLVLDATVGQNALSQVEAFARTAGVTGLVMTKLDGTARGGILVAIAAKHKLPIHLIGVGEGQDDLQPFAARDFARAIAGLE